MTARKLLPKADRHRGLYNKYYVERVDGSSKPGKRHHGCEYFVLDLTHDPYARIAIAAYAAACRAKCPMLANDLFHRAACDRIIPERRS